MQDYDTGSAFDRLGLTPEHEQDLITLGKKLDLSMEETITALTDFAQCLMSSFGILLESIRQITDNFTLWLNCGDWYENESLTRPVLIGPSKPVTLRDFLTVQCQRSFFYSQITLGLAYHNVKSHTLLKGAYTC